MSKISTKESIWINILSRSRWKMDWSKTPSILRERYKNISDVNWPHLKVAILEEMNRECLPTDSETDSHSYEIFANQFNSVMLTTHFFENLFSFEDQRHNREGNLEFEFEIPEEYFRHPSLRTSNDFSKKERETISKAVSSTKSRMNFSKDGSFLISQLHKLEFISVFSFLEAYIESILVEFTNEAPKKASQASSNKPIHILIPETFSKINPLIMEVINGFEPDTVKFFSFCRKVRNLHMHNLGVVTERFYKDCMNENLLCHDRYTETGQPVTEYARPNFSFCDYIIKVGRPVNLSAITQPFRLLSREIVFISETIIKEDRIHKKVNGISEE
ncbi:hypothetical protein [Azospirillum sp. B506]|uniref:hypothetical protein n=1 Tax=Azospirillum sp. B506 TaxID=137721 RepID=UPI001B3B69A5|nr:hypothetical protein [Azospirillum sp. B506]